MLPTGKKDRGTAVQIVLYTVWTILVSLIPAFGMTGKLFLTPFSAGLVLLLGLGMLYYAVQLYLKRDDASAKKLMLASVSYITLLQIIYVLDKLIRVWI